MSDATPPHPTTFASLDDARPNRFQMKIMFVSGMGFFTDAYDLFVIGIVVKLVADQWHLSTTQTSLLASTTLAASAFGALLFGRIADIFGRKKMYGVEVLILAVGAIASAFSPNITWLIIFRIIVGVGVGGDYPVSATIMSEYSGKASRGKMVGLVFAMQAAGLIVGPLVAVILLTAGLDHNLVWRLLLGLGAIPGTAVFYLRRQIHETPRFAAAGGDHTEALAAIAQATGGPEAAQGPTGASAARTRQGLVEGWLKIARNPVLLRWVIGAALAWGLMDFAYYGNTIASPQIISLLSPTASLTHGTLLQLGIFVVFAAPGYWVAIRYLDSLGRKSIQMLGFAMMAICYGLIGIIPSLSTTVVPFVLIFGVSYFFTEFGPNTTTFVYPAEIFPTEVRTTGHGIAAAMGKMGAFAGTYLFTDMLGSWGIQGAEGVAAGVAVLGLIVTAVFLPEPKGKTLEELERESFSPPASLVPVPA
ncbi:MAG TPA: MFS transporter [Solirubrobacteraceae bacterium]|nr:MFS transporter [Solirubrobacteraceae bacterium]